MNNAHEQAPSSAPASPGSARDAAISGFSRLYDIVARLRGAGGCPWDQEQTLSTLRGALLEESYETVEAITEEDTPHIREELGDVYLLATMMSYILEEQHEAKVGEVLNEVSTKLVRRHPHVFGSSDAATSEEVVSQWNDIKQEEKRARGVEQPSLLERVSGSLAPLRLAWEYQKKAAKAGFDWRSVGEVFEKLSEEIDELTEAVDALDPDLPETGSAVEGEIGDLLFTVVNLARFLGIEPDLALTRTNSKFKRRFAQVEQGMAERGLELSADQLELMDTLWNESKKRDE